MKKKIAKLLALGMSIALVFSLAACADDTNPDVPETTTEAVTTTEPQAEPATGDSESESASAAESESGEQPSDAPTVNITNPGSDVAKAVELYNNGIAGTNLSAKATRALDSAKVMAVINLLEIEGVRESFDWTSPQSVPDKLVALNAGDIASVSSNDDGSTITMEFTLKDFHGTNTAAHGDGGFMYFFTISEAATVVADIGHKLGGDSMNITTYETDKGTFLDLSKGTLKVSVNKSTGKVTSAELSFSEAIEAKVNAPIKGPIAIDATAKVEGHGTVTWG